jgi:hypothetical protein
MSGSVTESKGANASKARAMGSQALHGQCTLQASVDLTELWKGSVLKHFKRFIPLFLVQQGIECCLVSGWCHAFANGASLQHETLHLGAALFGFIEVAN